MNDEERSQERVIDLLAKAASRLTPSGDPDEFVEWVLTRGTDRLFTCDSPLGELYVGVSQSGVRLVGKATSPEEFVRRYRERFDRLVSWGPDESIRRLAERGAAAPAGGKGGGPA